MQLQPVKANLIYPSRVNRVFDLSKQEIVDVESILSGREVKNSLLLRLTQRKSLLNI